MARIPLVDENDSHADPEARAVLKEIEDKRGFVLNVYRGMANHPAIAKAVAGLYVTARGGKLSQKECELAYTAASVANSCHY
ncbi:MAG: hypothetical protein ACRDSJ_12765 [Rubrobacteraceae bacterium]